MAAIDELWFLRIESIVIEKIKDSVTPILQPKFENLYFVDTEVLETPPGFPCIEIRELEGVERGQTIMNDEIPAYMSTFQINVYVDTEKSDAREIVSEVINQFKKELAFNIIAMPIYSKNGNIHRYTARCRRMIGAGDSIVI